MLTTSLSFELTAKTFRYLDDAEVAAAEKSKAPAGTAAHANGSAKTQVMDMFSKQKNSLASRRRAVSRC